MDNKKIGELIAKLRKEKRLTQQELGDKVGVGSRAVSKWECGITIPDISIINELSNILGITSNELLAGKIDKSKDKNKPKSKLNLKLLTIILSIIVFISLISSIYIYFSNKTYVYEISEVDHQQFKVEGYLTYKNNNISLHISSVKLHNTKLTDLTIYNYEYYIKTNNELIFGYVPTKEEYIITNYNFDDIEEKLKIDYAGKTNITKNKLLNNDMHLEIILFDEHNKKYYYNIEVSLYKKKK